MKTLGIIGGTGPETTVEYYRRLIVAYRERSPEGHAPSLLINSIDSKKLVDLVTANELTQMADYLVEEVARLARAGAGLGLIAANTPHLVFDEVQSRSPIPMLSIVTATRDAAGRHGLPPIGAVRHALHHAGGLFSADFHGSADRGHHA
jgi:aspartate racemase